MAIKHFCIVCGQDFRAVRRQSGADDRGKSRLNCFNCGTEGGMITVEKVRDIDQEVEVLPKSEWMHRNNIVYKVIGIANYNSSNPKYPRTVIYQGVQNNRIWSRPLSDWHRSMRLHRGVQP